MPRGVWVRLPLSAPFSSLNRFKSSNENTLKNHLLKVYKQKAEYEAEEMHDWNSAKLYSEKALYALDGKTIKPQEIQIFNAVSNGIGVMQAWKGILTDEEIEAVAYYVFNSTNK